MLEENRIINLYKESFTDIRKGNFEEAYENFIKAYKLRSEVESKDFKRFSLYVFNKNLIREQIIQKKESQIGELLNDVSDLSNSYFKLKNEYENLNVTFNDQENGINRLNISVEKLETKVKKLKKRRWFGRILVFILLIILARVFIILLNLNLK